MIAPVVARANELRGEAPIRAHVTPHTFRPAYIMFMVAAGFDIPYMQAQVGHKDPATTLAVYAQLMRRPDRDELCAEIRTLLGEATAPDPRTPAGRALAQTPPLSSVTALRSAEKAGKSRALGR